MRAIQMVDLPLTPDLRELTLHGTPTFPCAAYDEDLDKFSSGSVPWHWHMDVELIEVYAGSMRVSCGETPYTIEAGNGIFVNSNVLHTCRRAGEVPCKIQSLVFKPELVSGFPQSAMEQRYLGPLLRCGSLPAIPLYADTPWQDDTLRHIRAAYSAFIEGGLGYEMLVQSELIRALYEIVLHSQKQIDRNRPAQQDKDLVRIKTMLEFIHAHYGEALSTAQIAAAASVSESECYRCFKKVLGSSPAEYLIQYRVRTAAGLLADTRMSVTDICYASGFNHPSYFARVFKQLLHCSPRQYRAAQTAPGEV